MVARGVNLGLEQGYTNKSPGIVSAYAIVLVAKFGEYRKAYEYSQLALQISASFDDLASKCQSSEIHIAHIHHWSKSLASSIPYCVEGFQAGLLSGGVHWSSYLCMFKTYNQLAAGKALDSVLNQEIQEGLAFTQKMKNQMANDVILGAKIAAWNLHGLNESNDRFETRDIDETDYLERCQANQSMLAICLYKILKAQILYLYGQYRPALQLADEAAELLAIPSFIAVAEHNFYTSLILAALYPDVDADEGEQYWQRLESNQAQMRVWADNCEANFRHKYLLVAAEMARISGQKHETVQLYNQAIRSAREFDFIQNEALANELAARFWLSDDMRQYAIAHLTEALYGFQLWGANRKVALLKQEFSGLMTDLSAKSGRFAPSVVTTSHMTVSKNPVALDMETILKSSHAISGEIDLGKLLNALIDIAIENAGAERGCLIMEKDCQWVIEADRSIADDRTTLLQSQPIDRLEAGEIEPAPISSTIINYVIRTGESLVLEDALEDDRFANDGYIRNRQARSILCMPLLNQGRVSGILYLENNLSSGVFSPERLAVLEVLSAQMAISLDNARLYNDLLDHRGDLANLVGELEAKNLELERFVYTVSHELKTPLVTISGFAGMLHKDMREGRSDKAEENVQFITSGVDTMSHLLDDLLELSRIGRVVNPTETVSLYELTQDAANFVTLQANAEGVEISISPDLPQVYGDRVRLREVVQNLIENAIKFRREGQPVKIEIGPVINESGRGCFVRDDGIGIEPVYHDRIFNLFERLNQKIDGTGVGLALAQRIVELHHGRIWVESDGIGKGSSFFFTISEADN
jgi:signal transduction histidine kinase